MADPILKCATCKVEFDYRGIHCNWTDNDYCSEQCADPEDAGLMNLQDDEPEDPNRQMRFW